MEDLKQYVEELGKRARRAAQEMTTVSGAAKIAALQRIAAAIRANKQQLIDANSLDIAAAQKAELAQPLIERLKLNEKRIESMAVGVEQIAQQVDPVGQTIEGYARPNGLRIEKRRVPLGVVLFFYESRPNVTSDAAALCIKSGNAVILRGGKEAFNSNRAIAQIVSTALGGAGLPAGSVQLVENTDRALVPHLLNLNK
jgi:glutamate-5-semialdehyde dehydrogenase